VIKVKKFTQYMIYFVNELFLLSLKGQLWWYSKEKLFNDSDSRAKNYNRIV